MLLGEPGCAQVPTPPALDHLCPFNTLHLLTCLYKASASQPAARCLLLLYGPARAQHKGDRSRSDSTRDQFQLLSQNSPEILTIYNLQG